MTCSHIFDGWWIYQSCGKKTIPIKNIQPEVIGGYKSIYNLMSHHKHYNILIKKQIMEWDPHPNLDHKKKILDNPTPSWYFQKESQISSGKIFSFHVNKLRHEPVSAAACCRSCCWCPSTLRLCSKVENQCCLSDVTIPWDPMGRLYILPTWMVDFYGKCR